MSEGQSTTESTVEYRDLPGFPGYRVGNDGSIWSSKWSPRPENPWRRLRANFYGKGYQAVNLRNDGRYWLTYLHRAVLETFVGPCPEGMECRHLDGIKTHNHLANLKWGTKLENVADKRRHGTINCGEKNGGAKLLEQDVVAIRKEYKRGVVTHKQIAERYGVNESTIRGIVSMKEWRHVPPSI